MTVEKSRVDLLCRDGARLLIDVPGVVGMRLLQALAEVESSYGTNANSRHESAYCRGGRYYDPLTTKAYGCAAHCSYGIWQVMFPTAINKTGVRFEPRELENPETNLYVACVVVNDIVDQGASTIEQIADAYNSGSFRDQLVPQAYIGKVKETYERFLV